MRKKNPLVAVIVLLLIAGALMFPRSASGGSGIVDGSVYFPFDSMDSDCRVTVIREDLSVSRFEGEQHQTLARGGIRQPPADESRDTSLPFTVEKAYGHGKEESQRGGGGLPAE